MTEGHRAGCSRQGAPFRTLNHIGDFLQKREGALRAREMGLDTSHFFAERL